jgi:hypothetical protein
MNKPPLMNRQHNNHNNVPGQL